LLGAPCINHLTYLLTQLPSSKGAQPPQFPAHICCGQIAGWIKMPLGMEVGLGPGDFVLDGDPAPHSAKKGAEIHPSPNFQPMSILAKRLDESRWHLAWRWAIGPGQIVLDEDPAPLPKKRTEPPNFGPFILWPNGCMYQDTTWCGGRPQPMQHCVRWGPSSPPLKGHSPSIFGQCPLWPSGWMDEDANWYGGRPRSRRLCVRWRPSSPR